MPVDFVDISSTEVRKMVREGRDPAAYLPPAVAEYIKKEGLYV